jgi:putative Mn2+ efflux pump MntP
MTKQTSTSGLLSLWFGSALLFAATEMMMPFVGLAIGYELSWTLSETMRMIGPLLLIGIGLWEVVGEARELIEKRSRRMRPATASSAPKPSRTRLAWAPQWIRPLLLALCISVDELVVGFSLGSVTPLAAHEGNISLLIVCVCIGIQGCLMTILGLALGRWLGSSMKVVKQWNEWIAGLLLIGLGVWLLLFNV